MRAPGGAGGGVCVREKKLSSNTANFFPSLLILITLMIEAIRSSETSVLTRDIQRNIPQYDIFHITRFSACADNCNGEALCIALTL
jgi:hypothetical protein